VRSAHRDVVDPLGRRSEGKSRFWGGVQDTLGPDYTVVPHKSLLVAHKHDEHATVFAALFRKRLAVASETDSGAELADERIKNLTGGDRLSGRRMREDPWEFNPSHTLILFSNHKPQVQGQDEGIWRRLRLVPWNVTIPEGERDEDLADKLRGEVEGILAWIVEGARRYLAGGFDPPDTVRAATADYRAEEDSVGRFVAECLRFGNGWTSSALIESEAGGWAADQGIPAPALNEITPVLKRHGCTSKRKTIDRQKVTIWNGVNVVDDTTEEPGRTDTDALIKEECP
jgi:putative DNA primase/helicase